MLKDIRYIIKKIIIGVAIATIVFLLKTQVFALSWNLDLQGEALIYDGVDYKEFTCSFVQTNVRTYFSTQFDKVYENSNNYRYAVFSVMSIFFYTTDEVLVPGTTLPGGTNLNYDFTNGHTYLSTQRIILYGDYGGAWSNCEWQNNYIVCPINPGQKYNRMAFWFESNSSIDLYYRIAFAPTVQLYNPLGVTSSQQEQTNQKLDEINSSIQSQTQDQQDNSDANVDVSNMGGINGLLPAGPVDSLLSLPLTLINLLISGTSGSCSPFTFTFVFGEQFTLPCFDTFWNQVPSSLLIFISDLPAVYIFIQWSKSIYKRVERAVSFESSVDDEWGGV